LAVCGWVCACNTPAARREYRATFVAIAEGEPLAGVAVLIDEQRQGLSGGDGVLAVSLAGREGDEVRVRAECPEGYLAESSPRRLVLRTLDPIGRSKPHSGLTVQLRCRPERRTAVLVVRTNQPHLPIRVRDQSVGETDADGVAHIALRTVPHSSAVAQLVTTAYPELSPQNPRFTINVSDSDEFYVLQQTFEHPPPVAPQRRIKPPAATRPVRLVSQRLNP